VTLREVLAAGFGGRRPRDPQSDPLALERLLRSQHLQILAALQRVKEQQMALTEQVRHLVEEVNQSRGLVASMATFVRGVPALIRQAVQEALAANPGLSTEDLAALSQAADDLDAGQADILSAMQANQVAGENTGVPPERTEMGGTVEPVQPQEGGVVPAVEPVESGVGGPPGGGNGEGL
jgi:hypothetical protein